MSWDADSSRRFLVADETGLGKTHVARGVISMTLDHQQYVDGVERIDIIYVGSNADIAAQNIRKLNVTGSGSQSVATRLSLLVTQPDVLSPAADTEGKPTTSSRSRRPPHSSRVADGDGIDFH